MYLYLGTATMERCTFVENFAALGGGGLIFGGVE